MKIGSLKRRADTLANEAWAERRLYKSHAGKSLSIARQRIGSTAGLAISFSLGFMTGAATDRKREEKAGAQDRNERDRDGGAGRAGRGFIHQLAHGPIGESATRLASAVVATSLMKYMDRATSEHRSASANPPPAEPPLTE